MLGIYIRTVSGFTAIFFITSQDRCSKPTAADRGSKLSAADVPTAGDSVPESAIESAIATLHTVVPLPYQQISALSSVMYISASDELAKHSYIEIINLHFSPW